MAAEHSNSPNPNRVAAGRANRLQRRGLSAAGRQRLREAGLRHQPWRHSTGPRTVAGKARSAANAKARQRGERSVREVRAELRELDALLAAMREARGLAGRGG